jgi:hypothetical protein
VAANPRAAGAPERRLLVAQYGVIARAQALQCGLTPRALQHRTRPGGPWQRVLPGVYVTTTGDPTFDHQCMAALLYAGDGSMITGLAALRRYQIGPQRGRRAPIQVLIPAARRRASGDFVAVERTTRMPRRFSADGPIQYALPARAAADAARVLTDLGAVRAVVAGVVQRGHCTVRDLAAELADGPRRQSRCLRIALAEVGAGVRSSAEADLRSLAIRSGLPTPLFNPRLYLGQELLAVPDAWWPEAGVAAEVDSREWHLSPADWEQTMRRHARLTAAGVLVLHFSPRQIREEPGQVVAAIAAALRKGRPQAGIQTCPPVG